MDRKLLRQKVCQRISVMKSNTGKHQSTRQNVNKNANPLELLRFFDELFDVVKDSSLKQDLC